MSRLWAVVALLAALHRNHTVGIEDSLLDGMSIVSYQPLENVGAEDYLNARALDGGGGGDSLLFSPPKLTLGPQPLGVPHIHRVTITNKLNRTVHLTSISGNSVDFHSSFFENKIVPPNGNTSFSIVFLGRIEGTVDSNIFIHTSEGVHKYVMSADGIPSEYRLPPLLKLRLPYNASYSPLIYMHNPHNYRLQITEVYSSNGNVMLELPGGGLEGPQMLWLLPPHTTRPIIAVRYSHSPVSLNDPQELPLGDKQFPPPQTSYIRIKFHGIPSMITSALVVAVEIYAMSESGPYAVPQFIDFGLGGTRDSPKKVRLFMGNSSPRPIRISSINVETDNGLPWGGLRVLTTAKTLLPPFSPPDIHIATLSLNWKSAYDSAQCCGKIVIKTRQDHRIELPFTSQPLNGGLVMNDESVTRYLSSESGITAVRQVLLKNTFKVGVFVADIVVGKNMEKYFEISGFYPQDFKVNTIQHGFRIQLKSWTKSLKFESKVTLVTNISSLVIPVYIYNGRLDLFMSVPPRATNKGTLDLGLVSVSSTTRANIMLYNSNPVTVCLRSYGTAVPGGAFQLLGCLPQLPISFDHISNVTACNCIQAKWYAVYSVSVVAPASAKTVRGELWVATVHERLVVPVALTAANGGRLSQHEPSKFDNCFPGTLCSLLLQIRSTFPVDMDVVSVEAVASDKRLYFSKEFSFPSKPIPEKITSTIVASELSKIGWLYYDPYLQCDGKCYTGLDLNSTAGQHWFSGITLQDTLEKDIHLVTSRFYLYKNISSISPCTNISIRVDTTQVRNHILSAHIPYIWPKLYFGPRTITAPLSQVDRPVYFTLTIVNPSHTRPLLVQLVLDWMFENNDLMKNLPKGLKPPSCHSDEWCSDSSARAFFFDHTNDNCLYSEGGKTIDNCYDKSENSCKREENIWTNKQISWLPQNVLPHPDTCMFILSPNSQRNITVTFLTHFPRKISTVLFIRNNLTIVEMVRLSGEGVVASLKFGNRRPGSNTPLLFDLTEKHLKDCDRDKNKKVFIPPNFTVKRTLVARNTGVIPVKVSRFFINNFECEGYGFRVLNCDPFELSPNGTHKVDIAFTPDFTLTKVQRLLIMETSLNDFVNFTLISSIPVSLAAKCASMIKRPHWESTLLEAAVFGLICMGICVVFVGCYESYIIWTAMSISLLHDPGTVQPPFNLRAIGQMGISKKTENWDCCNNTLECKTKENQSPKLLNWTFDESFKSTESRCNNTQPQKYEELNNISNNRNKKKVCKKNSNPSDSNVNESSPDLNSQVKELKNSKTENNTNWKVIFTRNSLLVSKNSPKYATQSNSSDSSETQKQVKVIPDQVNEKNTKLDSSKKHSPVFNGSNESVECNNQQSHFTNNNKKHSNVKCPIQSLSCEEDTSSTTTDSSNNDDADKENEISTSSSSNKSITSTNCKKSTLTNNNKKSKCATQCRDNYEGDGEDEEYDHKSQSSHSSTQNDNQRRWQKNRENLNNSHIKLNSDVEKQAIDNNKNTALNSIENSTVKQNRRENKNHPKREKQPISKKRSLDKNYVYNNKIENNQHLTGNFNITRNSNSTPPAIATVWENRASFSDVVSRSENTFSNNFVNRPKESQDSKKSDLKISTHTRNSDINAQGHNLNKFTCEEPRKSEVIKTNHSDLGPIGSNYYTKKSQHPTWSESNMENQNRQYRTQSQPVKNTQIPNMSDNLNLINSSGSSFFNSNLYFNNFADLPTINNPNIPSHNLNNSVNNFGSIGSSLSSMNNINNMQQMHYMPNSQNVTENPLQNLRTSNGDSNASSVYRDMLFSSNYDTGLQNTGYRMTPPLSMNGNLSELQSNQNPLDVNNGVPVLNLNKTHMSTIDPFDSYDCPWDRINNDNMNFIGAPGMHANDKMFEMDYGSGNYYDDNKGNWNGQPNLWNTPLSTTPTSSIQNNLMSNSDLQMQSNNTENQVSSSDCGAAEWLWGYNSNGSNSMAMENVPSNSQSDSISTPQSSHFSNQYQQHSPSAQQNAHPFDAYRSLNSIWSTGSSMDLWANQQNYGLNNQDPNNQHRQNHFQ